MTGLYFFVSITFLFFLIGFPLTRILPGTFKFRFLISSAFGYGIVVVITTIMYRYGISINLCFKMFIIAEIIGLFYLFFCIFNNFKMQKNFFIKSKKIILIFFLIWMFGNVILIAPYYTGGNQFTVFQGNSWDNFGYLNSAVEYAKNNYSQIINSTKEDFINNPLLSYAKSNLSLRPSVHILYSLTSQFFPSNYYNLYYLFLIFFFSQTILVFMFLLVNIFSKIYPFLIGLISLAFPLGFWGQYIFDINAWSQISSIPVLLLVLGIIIILITKKEIIINSYFFIRTTLVLFLLFSSILYLYPENLLFHLPIIFVISLVYFILKLRKKDNWNIVWIIFIGGLLGFLSGFLFFEGTIHFVFAQFNFSTKTNIEWWKYFQAYFLGRDGFNTSILLNNIIDFISSLSGLYFLTPSVKTNFIVTLLLRLFLITYIVYLIIFIFKFTKTAINKNDVINFNLKKTKNKIFLIFVILLILFSSYLFDLFNNLKYAKIIDPISVTINVSDKSLLKEIKIYREPPKSEIEIIQRNNNNWHISSNYVKNLIVNIPDNEINKIQEINIEIGSKKFSFSNEEFITKWGKIEFNDKNIIGYKLPDFVRSGKSNFKQFSSIINWSGDIKFLIKSISFFELFVILCFVLNILIVLKYSNKINISFKILTDENKSFLLYYVISSIIAFGLIILLLIKGNIWGTGKALSYAAPLFILSMSLIIFFVNYDKKIKFIKNPIIIFVIIQILFGVLRIYSSTQNDGIHYKSPYPSVQSISTKKDINWDVDKLNDYIKDYKLIEIDVKDRFYENYLILYLTTIGKNFYIPKFINSYFGAGDNIGYQKLNKQPEVTISNNCEIITINPVLKEERIFSNDKIKITKNTIINAYLGDGWNSKEQDFYSTKLINSTMIINTKIDNDKINLKLVMKPFDEDNKISIYLNKNKISDFVNKDIFVFENLNLHKGENIIEFKSLLLPRRYENGDPDKIYGYAFKSIVIDELK